MKRLSALRRGGIAALAPLVAALMLFGAAPAQATGFPASCPRADGAFVSCDPVVVIDPATGLPIANSGGAITSAQLPSTLGAKTSANSLSIAPASDATFSSTLSTSGTNPTSTLALPSTTTAYSANQLIANSATAGSVVVPSFAIATSAGSAAISRLRLSTNDSTSTAWPAVGVQVDLWLAAPTFTNGDRGTFAVATGSANHLGAYKCTMSAENGDGAYAECAPAVGSFSLPKLGSGTNIYWTLQTTSASGVTGASKVFTLIAELLN